MALWDPKTKTITNEFDMAFSLWKYPHQYGPVVLKGPPTDIKLLLFPLEWSLSKRGCSRLDDTSEYFSPSRLAAEKEHAESLYFYYPHLTRMPEGFKFNLSVKNHILDGSIQMSLCQKDGSEEDIYTVGISFLEFVKNKNGATAADAYRLENFWKLEAILNTGLIYGAKKKFEHLNAAMESSQTEEEKSFFGGMIRALAESHMLVTHDYGYLMNAWDSVWAFRIHCYLVMYPSRLELVEDSAKRSPEERTGAITFSANYKNIANDVVKRLDIKQDLDAKEPFLQVCLEDPLVPNSKAGINIPMERYGNGDRGNLWEIEASVKIMLLSNDDFIHKLPSLLRWIRCASTDYIKGYLLVLLKDCVGGDEELFHQLIVLNSTAEVRDQGMTLTEEEIQTASNITRPAQTQPQAESSGRRPRRCLIV